jgi:biotin operon repressor
MMAATKLETGLIGRLGRLTGGDGACCLPRYQGMGERVAKGPRFATALARARALADAQRLTAVAVLRREGELCGCEIQAALGISHATVSHHMSVLSAAGLVTSRRKGKWLYYRLGPDARAEVP